MGGSRTRTHTHSHNSFIGSRWLQEILRKSPSSILVYLIEILVVACERCVDIGDATFALLFFPSGFFLSVSDERNSFAVDPHLQRNSRTKSTRQGGSGRAVWGWKGMEDIQEANHSL